ncbi:MAG: hypothetical protein ACXAC7_18305 [Candidatus Hodarchaeales archaeon]|jgi:hypothetical protein
MSNQYGDVENYLKEVQTFLGDLPDKETIIQELRTHIWDLANDFSEKKGISVQKAFTLALQEMEDPQILAARFLEEEKLDQVIDSKSTSSWKAPARDIPEYKIEPIQFLVVGVIGILLVLAMAALVAITTDDPFVFVISLIFGVLTIGLFMFILYYKDDQIYQEQITLLRTKFTKWKGDTQPKLDKMKSNLQKTKVSPIWGNLGGHLEGFGNFFLLILLSFVVMWLTFGQGNFKIGDTDINVGPDSFFTDFQLFDEKLWIPVGVTLVFIIIGIKMIQALIQIAVGKIQVSRLISAFVNVIIASCFTLLVIFYPFTLEQALIYIFTDFTTIVDDPTVFSQADMWVRLILGIIAIVHFLNAIYDIIKFGYWKTSERKSLLST